MLLNLGIFWFFGNILPIREGKKTSRGEESPSRRAGGLYRSRAPGRALLVRGMPPVDEALRRAKAPSPEPAPRGTLSIGAEVNTRRGSLTRTRALNTPFQSSKRKSVKMNSTEQGVNAVNPEGTNSANKVIDVPICSEEKRILSSMR